MALPEIEDTGELEADEDLEQELGGGAPLEAGGELDPLFAADAAEAFPELDDAGLMALQRAISGLISGGGMGGMGGPPGMGF